MATSNHEELERILFAGNKPWRKCVIGEIVELRGGYAAATKNLDEKARKLFTPEQETIPLIQSSDLKSAKEINVVRRARRADLKDESQNSAMEPFKPGKLLLAAARSETAGRCGILNTEAIVNNAILLFTPLEEMDGTPVVKLDWLFYYFKWLDLQKYISNILSRGGGPYFTQKMAKELPIPVPSFSEQATVLQRIDGLLQEFQSAYDLLNKIEQDLHDLLSSALAKFFEPLEVNAHISKLRLEDLVSIVNPQDVPLPTYGHYPFIVPDIVSSGKLYIESSLLMNDDEYKGLRQKKLCILERNSSLVLYSLRDPAMQRATLFTEEYAICDSRDILPLIVKDQKLHPAFLMWSLIAPPFTRFATNQSSGTSISRASWSKLRSYLLPLPTYVEQETIVNQLNNIVDNHIEELRKKQVENRQSFDAVEQSILYKAFRGEL